MIFKGFLLFIRSSDEESVDPRVFVMSDLNDELRNPQPDMVQ